MAKKKPKPTEHERAEEVRDTLVRFHKLQRKATDEVGWVALHFSIPRSRAVHLVMQAKAILGEEGWPTS